MTTTSRIKSPVLTGLFLYAFFLGSALAADQRAAEEHAVIGVNEAKAIASHTLHPDAQWFPDAGFGLFIHWGIYTAGGLHDVSWPMIVGEKWRDKRITDPAERERIVRERDYNKEEHPVITPNEYWKLAAKFNPSSYDPEKWIVAAKAAGFTYAVLVTQHHEGYSMWPSAADDFNTRKYMGGRDLVKPFVAACRKHGLKVGLYYSPPNWHFDRDHMNFLYYKVARQNPEFPELDADLNPRKTKHTPEETAAHQKAYAQLVRKQVEELLTRYGKIDLLWFDGRVEDDQKQVAISAERIRELQPGIVMNPRLHGKGDFRTYENVLPIKEPAKNWAEFCHDWTYVWGYNPQAQFRDNAFILGELVRSRSLGVNYLLSIGPDKNGELPPDAYKNMAVVSRWMKANGESIHLTKPLPAGEKASVCGTSREYTRYLFYIPKFNEKYSWKGPFETDRAPRAEETVKLMGSAPAKSVVLLESGMPLPFKQMDKTIIITLPVERQGGLVDVVKVELAQ